MRKILTLAFALILTATTFGQDTTKTEVTPYIAAGLSMTNTTEFKAASYPSAEIGVMFDNMTVAGVFGRNNLAESTPEHIDNYWCEAKVAYSFPLGWVDGYGVFGVGTYIGTNGSLFIEYGGGICKSFNDHLGGFMQVSSWDGVTYFTPGLSVSF
jgi:hypothetical protein